MQERKACEGGSVSERNGDKSRFGRERKRKIQERKRIREFRKALEDDATRITIAVSVVDGTASLTLVPISPGQPG